MNNHIYCNALKRAKSYEICYLIFTLQEINEMENIPVLVESDYQYVVKHLFIKLIAQKKFCLVLFSN